MRCTRCGSHVKHNEVCPCYYRKKILMAMASGLVTGFVVAVILISVLAVMWP